MSNITKKLKLHRGSDLWRIMSDIIGKKTEAQKDLDQIQSALKLQDLVKEKLKELQLEDMGGNWVMVRQGLLENLIEESEK